MLMYDFLFLTFLLFVGLGCRSLIINNTTPIENRQTVSRLYSLNIVAIYLTLMISDRFYLTTYLGWVATIILVYGYFTKAN
jgi:hypothetical protein